MSNKYRTPSTAADALLDRTFPPVGRINPSQEPSISLSTKLELLDKSIASLRESVAKLGEQLDFVSRAPVPEPTCEGIEANQPIESPLAYRISQAAREVALVQDNVEKIASRLDL